MAEEVVDARAGEILQLRADAKRIRDRLKELKAELTAEYIDEQRDVIKIVTPDEKGTIRLKRTRAKPPVTSELAQSVLSDMTDSNTAKKFCKHIEQARADMAKETISLTGKSADV